ncbi:MAG: tetratricopeptide repeat protein, partial [bacterium]
MNKFFFSIAFVLFIPFSGNSQPLPDRIFSQIDTTRSDTVQLRLLKTLTSHYIDENNATLAIEYGQRGLLSARVQNNSLFEFDFLVLLAKANELSSTYYQSIDYYQEALEIAKARNDKKEIAYIFKQTGNVYFYLSDYTRSLDNHLKSLRISDDLGDQKAIATSLNNIGNVYYRQDDYVKARDYYMRSLMIEEKLENPDGIASCYINIGAVYESQFEHDTALQYYFKSVEINKNLGNNAEIASSYNNIANIYDKTNKPEKAMEYYLKSLEIYRSIESRLGEAETLISIGVFHNIMFESEKAFEFLEKALDIGKEIRSTVIVRDASKELSNSYARLRDFEKAYKYHIIFKKAEDRISNEDNIKRFTQMEMQYSFDKKQKELEYRQQMEMRRQRLITAFFILGFSFMLILAFVIYRSYKTKQKDNVLLAEQKNEIETQRDEIQAQRDIAERQRDQILLQKKEITDSIMYASRIQRAILPPEEFRNEILPDHFILNKPRDIVSGDFYWMAQKNNKVIVVAADCTGHGVPGAFMSMLGVTLLNEIVSKEDDPRAGILLNQLKQQVIHSLHQTGREGESKDGMDIALIVIDNENNQVEFAGAYNPLYIIRDDELMEMKADRMPIGIHMEDDVTFKSSSSEIKKGD